MRRTGGQGPEHRSGRATKRVALPQRERPPWTFRGAGTAQRKRVRENPCQISLTLTLSHGERVLECHHALTATRSCQPNAVSRRSASLSMARNEPPLSVRVAGSILQVYSQRGS